MEVKSNYCVIYYFVMLLLQKQGPNFNLLYLLNVRNCNSLVRTIRNKLRLNAAHLADEQKGVVCRLAALALCWQQQTFLPATRQQTTRATDVDVRGRQMTVERPKRTKQHREWQRWTAVIDADARRCVKRLWSIAWQSPSSVDITPRTGRQYTLHEITQRRVAVGVDASLTAPNVISELFHSQPVAADSALTGRPACACHHNRLSDRWALLASRPFSVCSLSWINITMHTWPRFRRWKEKLDRQYTNIDWCRGQHWTSRPAIAGNQSCSVFKLEPKYNCEKRASNIALSYGVDLDKWSFECFTSLWLCLYLMQNYAEFSR